MSEPAYPPAEPAEGDRTSQAPPSGPPRYSASASVPVPPPTSNTYGTQGGGSGYGQPSPFGQGAPPFGQPPAQPPQGQGSGAPTRVGASASVPVPPAYAPPPPAAPTTYGAPPQGYPAQPGVYGQPAAPTQYGTPPGTAAPPGPGAPPSAPPMGGGYAGGYPGPGQGGGYGQPQPYGQPEPARQQRGDKMVPTGGWPYVEQAEQPRKSRKGLTITVIIVAVLVVVGIGGYVGLKLATQSEHSYAVGTCVKQDGSGASIVDCSVAGAYRITSIVDTESGCTDASQPSLVLSTGGTRKYACLASAA